MCCACSTPSARAECALIRMGLERIYPIHRSGGWVRDYLATCYGDKYGDRSVGPEIVVRD